MSCPSGSGRSLADSFWGHSGLIIKLPVIVLLYKFSDNHECVVICIYWPRGRVIYRYGDSRKRSGRMVSGCLAQLAERRSLAGELTVLRPACSRRVTTIWVNRPPQVSQLGQLSLSSFRGR